MHCSITGEMTPCVYRLFWNRMVILLSVAINILMLVTWNARAAIGADGLEKNETYVPAAIFE